MGYFREAKRGSGLFFSEPIQGARGFGCGFRWYRCKAGVHSWLNVFLDSLLSQRMTKRETGMTEWGACLHLRQPRGSLFIFCFSGMARQRSAGGFVWFNHVKACKHATPCVDILPATITPYHRLTKLFIKSITEGFQLFSTRF